MNFTCPECSTVYRIDPARVPGGGVAAQCRECGTAFRVEAGGTQAPGQVQQGARIETAPPEAAPAEPSFEPSAPVEPAEPIQRSEPAEPAEPAEPIEPPAAPADAGEPTPGPAEAPAEPERAPAAPAFGPQDPETRARRLARALVSDIKVYNPEKWEQSREDGTLRKSFRDEILKSWDEYVEQVGEEMAKKTPYFREALNQILADGERVF